MHPLNDVPSETELFDGLWNAVSRDFKWVALPVLVTNLFIFLLVYRDVPLWASLGWLCLASTIPLCRPLIMRWIAQGGQRAVHVRLRMLTVVCILHGSIRSLSIAFFPFIPDLSKALLSLIQVSVCTSAIATLAGYLPLVLGFVGPILGSLSLMWFAYPVRHQDKQENIGFWIGGMLLLLLLMTAIQAKNFYANFKESFILRFQQRGLAESLKLALTQAESSNRAKTKFLAAASHDLRQPLHSLALFAMALKRRQLDARSAEISDCILQSTQALALQMDGLLDISKLDAGVITVEHQVFQLNQLVERLVQELRPIAEQKHLNLKYLAAEELMTKTDPVLLERMLRNLLDNAIKYSHQGSVELKICALVGQILVSIQDTGIGIALHEQDHIFEEFYQLDNPERDRTKGLGLGLAIVRRIANLLEIPLSLHSQENRGSCFELMLPLITSDISLKIHKQQIATALDYRILIIAIVDDEPSVRQGMSVLLTELGCQVHQADSSEALSVICQHVKPDLILADFRLRGSDNGVVAISKARQIWPQTPAVLISGDTEKSSLIAAAELGVPLHHKPVSFDILQRELERAVKHKYSGVNNGS
ncbi:ATP-binding response regulator [Undibacterium danionis]|uniref:histidine kinase n=1 Tax=Undibacterium danionis TaxID=1812100 RepID=A0ABV6IAR9_9BURK